MLVLIFTAVAVIGLISILLAFLSDAPVAPSPRPVRRWYRDESSSLDDSRGLPPSACYGSSIEEPNLND